MEAAGLVICILFLIFLGLRCQPVKYVSMFLGAVFLSLPLILLPWNAALIFLGYYIACASIVLFYYLYHN